MRDAPPKAEPATYDEVATIDLGMQRLRYGRRFGRRGAPPLLICNGIGANLEVLAPLLAALPGREILSFDVPGVGGSPTPLVPYRLRHIAALAAHLATHLGYDEAVDLLGVSWGGALAQEFAHRYPERCRKLILAATSCGALMVPGRLSVLRKLASPRRYYDPPYLRRIAPEIYGGALHRDPTAIDRHAAQIQAPQGLGYIYQISALWGWTSLPWLYRLRQPTLVLAGTEDPIVPMINARILAHLIPNARLETVDDGHLFVVTAAGEVAAHIGGFLGGDDA